MIMNGLMKNSMTVEEKKRFRVRYETMNYQQMNMTGETFDSAQKWLDENHDKFIECIK